jgi:hypothetical protein
MITILAMRDDQGVRIKTVIYNPSDDDMSQRDSPGIKLSQLWKFKNENDRFHSSRTKLSFQREFRDEFVYSTFI